jgi:hypothetical protein
MKRIRFHLSTIIIVTLLSGALLGANLTLYHNLQVAHTAELLDSCGFPWTR